MNFYTTNEQEVAVPETDSVSEALLFVLGADTFRASVPGVFVDDEAGLLQLVLGGGWDSGREELVFPAGSRDVQVRLHRATGSHPYPIVAATWAVTEEAAARLDLPLEVSEVSEVLAMAQEAIREMDWSSGREEDQACCVGEQVRARTCCPTDCTLCLPSCPCH